MRKLKDPCHSCGRPLDPAWKVCPYCEAEVGVGRDPITSRRQRRRRVSEEAAEQPSTT